MNILVTSGNISEFIDDVTYVQSITCPRIGAAIAEEFSRYSKVKKIFFVHTPNTAIPFTNSHSYDFKFSLDEWVEKIGVQEVNNISDLEKTIANIMTTEHIDCVVHLMSIPNYFTSSVHLLSTTQDALDAMKVLANDFDIPFSLGTEHINTDNTIQSGHKECIIRQTHREKIISQFAKLNPEAVLISTKVRNYKDLERTKAEMTDSMERNKSNLVIGIDLGENKKQYKDICFLGDGQNIHQFTSYVALGEKLAADMLV
ncbi:phosphopantothenate--cysteine ligase [Bacillus cereus]|nr:hypothetical protein [Bacillus cereus]HDR8327634.1 hypothetical protein [Bacillus cereus]HDR8334343.1 hypothetical protein [Bacillus cereus]